MHELGTAFEVLNYPFDKALRAPEFLSHSPAGRVPALEIGGRRLFETGAIAEFLCEEFSPDDLGRRPGTPERAEWLVWMHFAETISQHAAALTQQHVALREDHMRSPIVMKLEAARLGKCYAALEARFEETGGAYLLDGFSAADIGVGQAVYMARHFAPLEGYTKTADWYARITARPGFQASLPKPEEKLFEKEFYPPWPMP